MKPPFQYPRRAEADNFRTKEKLVRSAFRSPRSIAVGSHQRRGGPASLVNGFSSAATAHLNRFWSSEVPNHKQCHGPKPEFLCRLCGWGSRCASASKLQEMGDSRVIPSRPTAFGVDSFTDTRAAPSWRISSIKQSHDLARHFELPPSATGPVKIWGRPDRYRSFIRHSAIRRHAVDYAPEMLAKLRQEVVGAIPDWRDMVSAPNPRRKPSAAAL